MIYKLRTKSDTIVYVEVDDVLYENNIESSESYQEGLTDTSYIGDKAKSAAEKALAVTSDLLETGLSKLGKSISSFNSDLIGEIHSSFKEGSMPSEISLEYGLDIIGELDIKFAKSSVKSAIKLSMTWKL